MLFVCHNTERMIEMSMQSINFNSGNYKEYAINGDENRVIRINVSDVGIITRIQDAMSNADNIAEEVSEREKNEDRTQLLKEYDQRAREMVNDIFGSDVCTAALGSVNVFSVASNGKPVLVNFLEALLVVVVQEIKSAQTAAQIKLEEKEFDNQTPQSISESMKIFRAEYDFVTVMSIDDYMFGGLPHMEVSVK